MTFAPVYFCSAAGCYISFITIWSGLTRQKKMTKITVVLMVVFNRNAKLCAENNVKSLAAATQWFCWSFFPGQWTLVILVSRCFTKQISGPTITGSEHPHVSPAPAKIKRIPSNYVSFLAFCCWGEKQHRETDKKSCCISQCGLTRKVFAVKWRDLPPVSDKFNQKTSFLVKLFCSIWHGLCRLTMNIEIVNECWHPMCSLAKSFTFKVLLFCELSVWTVSISKFSCFSQN